MEYKKYLLHGDDVVPSRTIYRHNLQHLPESMFTMVHNTEKENVIEQPDVLMSNSDDGIRMDEDLVNTEIEDDIIREIGHETIRSKSKLEDPATEYLNPKSLQDFMNSEIFIEKINTPVDKTRGEIFLMILKFCLLNSLSMTGITNLFKLINTIFQVPILPNSSYIIDKLLNPKHEAQFHAVCPHCSLYLGEFGSLGSTFNCDNCKQSIDVSNSSNTNFFVLLNPSTQIAETINNYSDYYHDLLYNKQHKQGYIEDVYDSNCYRHFVSSLPESERHRYISTVFNTDGAPVFESSQYSIWPLYLKINELPKQERMKHLVTCGLWFGKKKPDMIVFLDKFVNLINSITEKGILCRIKEADRLLRLYVVSCCVDSTARPPIQGIKQFNGRFGCNWCLHPGFYAENSMRYPFYDPLPEPRTHKETLHLMLNIPIGKNNVNYGIKYPSPMINLPKFDIVLGFVPDYLHCCLEGVSKQFSQYFFGAFRDHEIKNIDAKMSEISAPLQIGRLCRPLSVMNDWKAREWENFTLYYSVPLLATMLSKRKFEHWLLYVESLYILLKEVIHIDELNRASQLLHLFVWDTEEFYGLQAMTFNVHQLLHLSNAVANWGPLWTNSTYSFESTNYDLLRAIKSANGVTHQIIRFVNLKYDLGMLETFVSKYASAQVLNYCNEVLERKLHNVYKINSIRYIGEGDEINNYIIENVQNIDKTLKFYRKIVKSGCLYESENEKKKRSNNSCAQLKDGRFIMILRFIVDTLNKTETTMCKIVSTKNFVSSYNMLQKVERIEDNITFVNTSDIQTICIYMKIRDSTLLCPIPNLLHY